SKGPAVQSPRAQSDRLFYAQVAQRYIDETDNLHVIEDTATGVNVKNGKVMGVYLGKAGYLSVASVIITAGTFLNGKIFIGLKNLSAGRAGEKPAFGMTESLQELGLRSGRLKTGTPMRIHKDSIDYSKVQVQYPDDNPRPFSYSTKQITRNQINCFITYTNETTHDILRQGFHHSPLFTGTIKGVGPRYCPSIEDKISRFADKTRHQLFLEPEGYTNNEVYVNGFSSSLPGEIQERAVRTVAGLENVNIVRLGYAVEYDFFPPDQIKHTLETKAVENLYLAGQINGTSGYEEAAAQGFMAGINAVLKLTEKDIFTLSRSQAYIGVLIDDLINKVHDEPYRMFTSRAEFRLLLRQGNADLRLMEYGRGFGLIDDEVYGRFLQKQEQIERIRQNEIRQSIEPAWFNHIYRDKSKPIKQKQPLKTLLKRPEVKLADFIARQNNGSYEESAINEVEFNIKYSGYVDRQNNILDRFKRVENKKMPKTIDYKKLTALSVEAREKLDKIKPENLGQATRIAGVTPSDISALMVYLVREQWLDVSRGTQ
ncbi:MAG: tRNA uridine-5-carboxymethylaminomethyl(34) synthesis enzyme MnmG, partial [Caldithrix sp.]|nr:tRNA uridine-5-carboxymethylaminomethyl(34) synthesis enzyme MnmG [Caldithrix sp.]